MIYIKGRHQSDKVITFFCCWTPFHLRNLLRVLNVHLHDANCQFLDDLANIGMKFVLWRQLSL